MKKRKVIITTVASPSSGYYKYHFSFAQALQQLGWNVKFVFSKPDEFIRKFPNITDTVLIVAVPGEYFKYYINYYGSRRIIFSTFYEILGRVPMWSEHYTDDLLIITPSRWSQECLRKNYVGADINLVTSPYFVDEFLYIKKTQSDKIRFYYVGTNIYHKNLDKILKTFLRYFAYRNDVEFLIHSINSSLHATPIRKMLQKFKTELGHTGYRFVNLPSVKLNFSKLTSTINVHSKGDILVALSTGEGYHLPSIEALAVGNFLVTTDLGFVWYNFTELQEKDDYFVALYKNKPVGVVIKCNRQIYVDSDDYYHSGFSRTLTFNHDAVFKAYQEAFYLSKYNSNKNYYIDLNKFLLREFNKQFQNVLKKYEERL